MQDFIFTLLLIALATIGVFIVALLISETQVYKKLTMRSSRIRREASFLGVVALLCFGFVIGARIGQAIWDTYLG